MSSFSQLFMFSPFFFLFKFLNIENGKTRGRLVSPSQSTHQTVSSGPACLTGESHLMTWRVVIGGPSEKKCGGRTHKKFTPSNTWCCNKRLLQVQLLKNSPSSHTLSPCTFSLLSFSVLSTGAAFSISHSPCLGRKGEDWKSKWDELPSVQSNWCDFFVGIFFEFLMLGFEEMF